MDTITTAKANWAVIAQAPWVFVILTILLTSAVWVCLSFLKAEQISSLESRLKLRDDEIADYKRKLPGGTADEAKAEMDAAKAQILTLEAKVNQLSPRRVTAAQREQIRAALVTTPSSVTIGSDMACADAPVFSAGIAAAFTDAGWNVVRPSFMGLANPPTSGLGLRVANAANLTSNEKSVADILRSSGLEVDIQTGKSRHGPIPHQSETDIELVITPRVQD